jgi:hypothetical protein
MVDDERWKKRLTFQPAPGTSIMDAFKVGGNLPEPTESRPIRENKKEVEITEVKPQSPWYWSGEGTYGKPREYAAMKKAEHHELMQEGKSPLTPREKESIQLRRRQEDLAEERALESQKRAEFDQWKSSPSGAPLRFAETVGARFLNPRELRRIPQIPKQPLGGYKKYGRGIERRKAQWIFNR